MLARRSGLLALVALVAAGSAARAEDAPFSVHTLANGLTVLMAPSPAHPVISLSAFVTTGGRTEDEYYQGSLHYIEHLVFKGNTRHFKPTEFRKRMSVLGREAGGWTWDDEINFGFEVPKETFDEAHKVFREALLDLKFEKDWFESEKLVVLQEMTTGREQPDDLVDETWDELAYDFHPYQRSVIGTEKAIHELDMKKTYRYYKDRFSPNHLILSIAGDFDETEMLAKVDKVWGRLKKGPESFELGLSEPEQLGPRRRTDFVPQASTAVTILGVVGPSAGHEDTPALELLAALLNDATVGLPQFLEEQEKWVLDANAYHYSKRDASDFRVFVRAEPEKSDAVNRFVERFLLDFDVQSVPEEIFEQTRRSLLLGEARARETAADRAERFGFLVSRRGADAAAQLVDRWTTITPAAVQAAKLRWIQPRKLVVATVLPDGFDPAASVTKGPKPRPAPATNLPPLAINATAGNVRVLPYEKTSETDGAALFTYANGLRLLVRPTSASGLLAISGRALGGQWVEPVGKDGVNRFVAEMGLRSTRHWDRPAFEQLLRSRSIEASAHIGVGSRANTSRHVDYRDSAAHHYLGLAQEWQTMLACLRETMFFPTFPAKEVEKAREDLMAEARRLPENQLEYLKQEFYRRAFPEHPYGRVTFGTEATLKSISAAELKAFHAQNWIPSRVVVAVVGDIRPEDVAQWMSLNWAEIGGGTASPWTLDPATVTAAPAWRPPRELQNIVLGKDLWCVNWGRPGVAMSDPDYMTSVVLSRVAGNDHFYKYVYGEGVSYRSWIRFWEHLGPGVWIIENDIKRERFDEIRAMFEADLVRYAGGGLTEPEFNDAVQRLVNTQVLDTQSNAMSAWKLAIAEGNGLGYTAETQMVPRLRAVEYLKAQEMAREVFAPEGILRVALK